MKKTLVAIAALAVVGSAVAQVTISGQFAAGARKDGSVTFAGFTDGNVNFASKESLGGGLSVAAVGGIYLNPRDKGVNSRNYSLALSSTTAGELKFASSRVNVLSRLSMGGAVSLGQDLDDLYGADTELSGITYTAPKMGNVTLSYGVSGRASAQVGAALSGQLLTDNLSKTGTFGAAYAAGPLSIGVNYRPEDGRTRADLSFDAKVAVIEAHMNNSYGTALDSFTEIGIAVPMGAMTFGAGYSSMGDASGTVFGVSYALSKQTSIQTAFANLDKSHSAAKDGAHSSIKLNHTF
jgi:hypothetical protein